jgi:hypothetical protein
MENIKNANKVRMRCQGFEVTGFEVTGFEVNPVRKDNGLTLPFTP